MNNLTIEKSIHDEALIRLEILVEAEYVTVKQYCYVDNTMLLNISKQMKEFISNQKPTYIEVGHMQGNYTPAFSMNIESIDSLGHIRIEMDLEIDDNQERIHRCQTYIFCDLGDLEQFERNMSKLSEIDNYEIIKLIK